MYRALLESTTRRHFFQAIKDAAGLKNATAICGVGRRSIRDWARGKYRPPVETIKKLAVVFAIPMPKILKTQNETEIKRIAGKKGALARMARYGNPGTQAGRRKGGIIAIQRLQHGDTKFILRAKIKKPQPTIHLAELFGAIIGDGSISVYQVTITLNLLTDAAYAQYIQKLFNRLFRLPIALIRRKKGSVINIVASSIEIVSYLKQYGLVQGNKIKQQIDIPMWIKENPLFLRACMRGLFDTDGCIYLDTHRKKGKYYQHMGVAFTSYSWPLLASFNEALQNWGFHPTISKRCNLLLRREKEIVRFFKEIGSSNPKHRNRFLNFLKIRGGVPKWS